MSAESVIIMPAEEARMKAKSGKAIAAFLQMASLQIRSAVEAEKLQCVFTHYEPAIGDVNVLYSRSGAGDDALTEAGMIAVKRLRDLGYVVSLDLFYEERQFVDMRLRFTIDWSGT